MIQTEIKPLAELPPCNPNAEWNIQSITYNIDKLSYEHFFINHLRNNIPCIVKNVGKNWECSKKWIHNDEIDYDYMIKEYGYLNAPVVTCNSNSVMSHVHHYMKISDFMNYLRTKPRTSLIYVKDWCPRSYTPAPTYYNVPDLFGSDWLNEYASNNLEEDFMFVSIGPKYAWQPMRIEFYNAFNWSISIVGKRKWILFPPGEENKLMDDLKESPVFFEPEKYQNVKHYEFIQEKGDTVVVPSNWYYQVVNLDDNISINHIWVNGCNIETVWHSLIRLLATVEQEAELYRDLPEFPSLCQNMLKCIHGIDFEMFVKWLLYIGERRLLQLQHTISKDWIYKPGANHLKFDLKCISNVFDLIADHPCYKNHEFELDDDKFTAFSNLFKKQY